MSFFFIFAYFSCKSDICISSVGGSTTHGLCLIFLCFMDQSQHLGQRDQSSTCFSVPDTWAVGTETLEQHEGWSGMEKPSQGAWEARENPLPNLEHKLTRSLLPANRGVIKFTNPKPCSYFQQWAALCVFVGGSQQSGFIGNFVKMTGILFFGR